MKKASTAVSKPTVRIVEQNRRVGKKERAKAKKQMLHEKLKAVSNSSKKNQLQKSVPTLKNMKSISDCLDALLQETQVGEF